MSNENKITGVEHILDTKGLTCPEPVMMLHGAIRDAALGDCVVLEATDPSTQRDIKKFCDFLGHTLAHCESKSDVYYFRIIKNA